MSESATRKPAARPAAPVRENVLPPLRVAYYHKMKRGRVYPVVVGWKRSERGVAGKEVTLRLVMGGTHVVPAEHTLHPGDPEAEVTFQVAPLARGRLGDAHLEVVYQGRKVQDMPLPARATTQTLTWWLVLLAFLLPWALLEFFKYGPLQDPGLTPGQTLSKLIGANVPDMPRVIKEQMPLVDVWMRELRDNLGDDYDDLVELCRKEPMAFHLCWFILVLALVSLLWHADKKKRRMGRPISIPAPAG